VEKKKSTKEKEHMSRVSRHTGDKKEEKSKRREVVPGIELGLPESESDVLTITLYNHLIFAMPVVSNYISGVP
jgi:hypothetical protein